MPLLRHYLDVSTLTHSQFTLLLPLLPPQTQTSITRYHFPEDRSLSLGSALLQRHLICAHYAQYTTLRSAPLSRDPLSGRPFHTAGAGVADYNVSHHSPRLEYPSGGERCIVALAAIVGAEAWGRRVGVDVVPTTHRRDGAEEFVDTFCGADHAGVFTAYERAVVMAQPGIEGRVRRLYLLWALKEAYTKAIGVGVVMDLTKIEFRGLEGMVGERWTGAEVWVDGRREERWYLEVSFLPGRKGGEGVGFWIAVCCDRAALAEGDEGGEWKEVDLLEEIVKPYGGESAKEIIEKWHSELG
ncbi:hypothetical protein FN846DRAFT_320170 [Sphaerosporella brunnea]|uniref:holo-[acyl-carrier-protein] synthase n=1 Tax=Sphaerosporella brunnea TaxID=1250544 RepID=A0A5J5EKV0_9PEZI|nr:hypothetical protein FN846DRAFT_320170 [Sphaerosporella brunnea]